jgi:hypothetical protein
MFMRIPQETGGHGARHQYPADIPPSVQITSPRETAAAGQKEPKMNKAVGGVSTPTALPAPDLKLAYAIR